MITCPLFNDQNGIFQVYQGGAHEISSLERRNGTCLQAYLSLIISAKSLDQILGFSENPLGNIRVDGVGL
jgi:hypothetical protein